MTFPRLQFWCALAALSGTPTSPMIPATAGDANARMEKLLFESEDLRQMHDEVRRFWGNDQPSHMTYQRVHGGIGP